MITNTMTRAEIANHLRNEFVGNKVRITNKMVPILKKLNRAGMATFSYKQITPNKTPLTIYIYHAPTGAYVIGTWYKTSKGKVFVTVGVNHITFYNEHFYQRYAERMLASPQMSVEAAAQEYYKSYKIGIMNKDSENPVGEGVYEFVLHLEQGFGLGYTDDVQDLSVINTFVSKDMFSSKQLKGFESSSSYHEFVNQLDRNEPLIFRDYYREILKNRGIDDDKFENYTT